MIAAVDAGAMVSVRTLTLASMYQLAAVAVAAAVCALRWPEGVSGVVLGGMVMSANFAAARALAARVLRSENHKAAYAVGLSLKFVLLLVVVAGVLAAARPDVMAFGLGLTTFLVGVLSAVVHQSLRARQIAGQTSI